MEGKIGMGNKEGVKGTKWGSRMSLISREIVQENLSKKTDEDGL